MASQALRWRVSLKNKWKNGGAGYPPALWRASVPIVSDTNAKATTGAANQVRLRGVRFG